MNFLNLIEKWKNTKKEEQRLVENTLSLQDCILKTMQQENNKNMSISVTQFRDTRTQVVPINTAK